MDAHRLEFGTELNRDEVISLLAACGYPNPEQVYEQMAAITRIIKANYTEDGEMREVN
jgi:hypothetical protein